MERDRFVRFLSNGKDLADFCAKHGGLFHSEIGNLAYIAETPSPNGYIPILVLAVQVDPPHQLCLIERQTHYALERARGVEKEEKQKKDTRRVYLMKNLRNGFIKIGFSRFPLVREATLQAEEPTIELLATGSGGPQVERSLHWKFAHKRVRGEWFDLSAKEISEALQIIQGVNP